MPLIFNPLMHLKKPIQFLISSIKANISKINSKKNAIIIGILSGKYNFFFIKNNLKVFD